MVIPFSPALMTDPPALRNLIVPSEGGYLLNKDGYRFLQDYGLGPAEPSPRNKAMELGPRDRLSQAISWSDAVSL